MYWKYNTVLYIGIYSIYYYQYAPFCPTRYYDSRYITREQGQMLIIPHVRETDNGEYCCLANNGVGEPAKSCGALQLKMSMSAFFQGFRDGLQLIFICRKMMNTVRLWPNCSTVQMCLCLSPLEPQIKRQPTNVTLLVDSKAVLPCVTLGNPKPDVTWLKDDELIKVCTTVLPF